jgi:hypothetical protein
MPVTLEEAKTYLRVDSGDEDGLISDLISTAMQMCRDVARADDTVTQRKCGDHPYRCPVHGRIPV